jgi:prepilin-type N-terminal cleavage/methylation domain-containing protein
MNAVRQILRKQQGPDGFTLIELLAVVAIIGLAFGIAMAALPGMTRGSAMRGSTAELRATISLARQWAVGHREKAYVVFANGGHYSGTPEENLAGERAYRGYAVWGEKSGFISDWKFLKPGVYFLPGRGKESVTNYSDDSKNPFKSSFRMDVPFPEPGPSAGTKPFPAIGFKPDGGLTSGAAPKEIYISEGYITAAVGKDNIAEGHLKFKPEATITGFEIVGLTGVQRVRVYGEE